MKKTMVFTALFICVTFGPVFAGEVIKGPLPEKLAAPEKCTACHKIPQIYSELSKSAHSGLKCLDCHLPGAVQRTKYESKDCSFSRLGYHEKDGNWVEVRGNEVCLRCHAATGIKNTDEKCWSCHMAQEGMDKIQILKDKTKPATPDNIREIKEVPHKSHTFRQHVTGEKE
ncbi:MAG: NapC/NirT family cytochrome c [Thermodesulfobacteriota bacterium]